MIDDVYENLKDYNPTMKKNMLVVFGGMMSDMEVNKKLKPIVVELFMREPNSTFHLLLYPNLIAQCIKL